MNTVSVSRINGPEIDVDQNHKAMDTIEMNQNIIPHIRYSLMELNVR